MGISTSLSKMDALVKDTEVRFHNKRASVIDITPASTAGIGGLFGDRGSNREKYSLFSGWLYSAIHALASEAAGQNVYAGRIKGSGISRGSNIPGNRRVPSFTGEKIASKNEEIVVDHPILNILARPNPIQHRWQFVYSFVTMINLTGWAYIVGGRNEEGDFELYALPTDWVKPDHKNGPYSRFKIIDPTDPTKEQSDKDFLTRDQVSFAYVPNPADPRLGMAPAGSQIRAAKIDQHIQTSQSVFFENGVFPSVIVTIGRDPHPDVPGGIRPRLNPTQRRQVMAAVRKSMAGVSNYGNPAIVDGLIEKIERLSATSNEMGWEKSEEKVRNRILSAFCVHPYILGEPVNVGGYAQAAKIEERFCKRTNSFLEMLETVVTDFVPQVQPGDTSTYVKWDRCEPHDPSLFWAAINAARTRGDISRNEVRAKLGFPPDETGGDRTKNYTAGDINAIVQIQASVAAGNIEPEQAASIYEIAFDMTPEEAKKLAGKKRPSLPLAASPAKLTTAPPKT